MEEWEKWIKYLLNLSALLFGGKNGKDRKWDFWPEKLTFPASKNRHRKKFDP